MGSADQDRYHEMERIVIALVDTGIYIGQRVIDFSSKHQTFRRNIL